MIEDYIEYVSLKRKELGGHAICPFAKPFLDKTQIIESADIQADAMKCMSNTEHPMLYLLYADKDKYDTDWLDGFCSIHEKYSRDRDLWLIWDHPDQINKINGIKTSNNQYAILFIQPLSELNKYADRLSKTSYYSFWDKDYYLKVVKSRNK